MSGFVPSIVSISPSLARRSEVAELATATDRAKASAKAALAKARQAPVQTGIRGLALAQVGAAAGAVADKKLAPILGQPVSLVGGLVLSAVGIGYESPDLMAAGSGMLAVHTYTRTAAMIP